MEQVPKTLNSSLVKAIGELTNPIKSAINPHFKSEYATLEEITKHIRPILAKYNLALLCEAVYDNDSAGVKCKIIHADGEILETEPFLLPVDRKNAQAVGSAITYARRYMICALLNIAGDKDDDGNKAAETPPVQKVTEQQKQQWIETAEGDLDLIKRVLNDSKYKSSNDVPIDEFETINDLIQLEVNGLKSMAQ